jgi:hypothetical protein
MSETDRLDDYQTCISRKFVDTFDRAVMSLHDAGQPAPALRRTFGMSRAFSGECTRDEQTPGVLMSSHGDPHSRAFYDRRCDDRTR